MRAERDKWGSWGASVDGGMVEATVMNNDYSEADGMTVAMVKDGIDGGRYNNEAD